MRPLRYTDLMALQMGNRVQHGLLAIVQDVVVRQRYAVDSRVYQALERVRLRTESKGFIREPCREWRPASPGWQTPYPLFKMGATFLKGYRLPNLSIWFPT